MDTLAEEWEVSDVETEMTALTADEDITEQNIDESDEVEHLRKSLREVIHDVNVRPKMQCLMMDSSFSMVTMQGEDSGIAWETTPSRCNTPWASEVGKPTLDFSSPITVQPATPGSVPAGKIIFVMDDELLSRRKRTKERVSGMKSKVNRQREVLVQSSEDISGRPELVSFSQPNVKTEDGEEAEVNDPLVDKEQRLFSLVSEGSEILNIVVPPKVSTVDEEESKEMVDNLSYLEDSPVPKASRETNDYELAISTKEPAAAQGEEVELSSSNIMDPPGAPVARCLNVTATGNVDYFEAYNLIDAQAPGSPAVTAEGHVVQEESFATESQDIRKSVQAKETTTDTAVDKDELDTISLAEITFEILDDVFYCGTDKYPKSLDRQDGTAEGTPTRPPLKVGISTLFGSQEDILTPIFLPEGPPKIIDPILLEEPKAMAFLYSDLYEEAVGSRKKEEDTESISSEKSFHSRYSDREAWGYLEKYVLIDETPVVEMELADEGESPEEGPRVLSQDLYEFGDFLSELNKDETPGSEEEITDFFRSSANSSQCDKEPFFQSLKEDEPQPATITQDKKNKSASVKAEKVAEIPTDPVCISGFEIPSEEPDWGIMDEYLTNLDEHEDQDLWKQDMDVQKPVVPPRRKSTLNRKACLDLTALIPINVMREKEEGDGKEQKEEEKETASPVTVGKQDGEEIMRTSCNVDVAEIVLAVVKSAQTETVNDNNKSNTKPASAEGENTKTEEKKETTEAHAPVKKTESKEADIKPSESAKAENYPEELGDGPTDSSTQQAKEIGQCIIL